MFAADSASERATSIEDYQNTCAEFIKDISRDYADWVDRYHLGEEETARRKSTIASIVETTNSWIFKYANTIKKVDVVMNDGVNKMAENTAGYPFPFEIKVNGASHYTQGKAGEIHLNVRASPRQGRMVRIGNYQKEQILLISSSGTVNFSLSGQSQKASDLLDDYIVLDARQCTPGDLVSVTTVVEEIEQDYVAESRGFSTIILLT